MTGRQKRANPDFRRAARCCVALYGAGSSFHLAAVYWIDSRLGWARRANQYQTAKFSKNLNETSNQKATVVTPKRK
jgi:hypothetical protein